MILRILCCAILQFCIIGYVFGVVPQITRLNVQCDRTGMKVNVEFDNPFNGIIFSKGHYSDPNCRWVAAASTRRQFNFYIATNKCGTIGTDMTRDSTNPQGFKNVLIIQNDPDYQEVWDTARKLSCDWVTRLEKYVTFAPFGVDMLGVKELRFPGDTVDCWMDIQRGHGPFAQSVGGVVPIGEKLTVVIYVRDTDSSFDVHVKDCYAYDSADYRSPNARAIKLTDERGCPLKEKLVQGFYRTRDVRTSGATIIAYGIINAFKFPERMDVFLACNVEVCKGTCPNNDCQPEVAVAGEDTTSASTTAAPATEEGGEEGTGDSSSTTEATSEGEGESEKPGGPTGGVTEEPETSEETTEKPSTSGEGEEETKDEEKKDEEKKMEGEESKDEESKDETETKDEETKDEETKDEEKKDEEKKDEGEETKDEETKDETETKDEEKKDEESKDETETKDEDKEESKDEEKEESTDTKEESKDEEESESKDTKKEETKAEEEKDDTKEQTKESKTEDEEEEEAKRKRAAKFAKVAKKAVRKAKKADVITPRKRSAKKPARKIASALTTKAAIKAAPKATPKAATAPKPKSSKLKKPASNIKQVRVKKSKKSVVKTKSKPKAPKVASLRAAPSSARISKSSKVKARIIRAPSSIPAAFSRQHREMNMAFDDMYQRQGRHIRSRRSITVLSENATFPAMMHSISIISPIEDLDEKELNAWEKMMDIEGKAEEVSVFESITKLPIVNGEGAYCFSMVSLVSASILFAAIVMIISLSVAMVCTHLHSRSSKATTLY